MARLPRLNLADIPQHVIQRGNNRQVCFIEEQDYKVYLVKLLEYSEKYKVAVHAFVLMTNHVHILATPSTASGISQVMQSLGRYYVRYINVKYKRSGTLWEGRFKSTLVQSDLYFLSVMRYIELNPVRAQMATLVAEYPWSSFQHNGLGKKIELITSHPIYIALASQKIERLQAYIQLFDQQLSKHTIQEIRDATNKSWVLGDAAFKRQIEEQIDRRCSPYQRGGDHKSEKYQESMGTRLLE
ncbi:MAG: transposase [Oceanospirillaceae bacterium]|nr:transposase [Oceanospirillaceae bacterium]